MHDEDAGEVAIGAKMDIVKLLQPDAISPLEPHVPSIHACCNSTHRWIKASFTFCRTWELCSKFYST